MRRRRSPALLRQGAFLLVCAAAIYLPLAPLAPGSERVAPDVLFCVVIAWVLRDPASAPAWIIIAAGLVADLVLARPVGLGALGLLAASELARAQRDRIHGINILVEWIAVLLLFVLTWAATLFVLRLSFAHSGVRNCRDRTEEELAALPRNMRNAQLCERRRAPVRIEMDIDGTTVYAADVSPTGLAGSGPSRMYERFELPAGDRRLTLRLQDDPSQSGYDYEAAFDISLAPGESIAVDFDAASGGFYIH